MIAIPLSRALVCFRCRTNANAMYIAVHCMVNFPLEEQSELVAMESSVTSLIRSLSQSAFTGLDFTIYITLNNTIVAGQVFLLKKILDLH